MKRLLVLFFTFSLSFGFGLAQDDPVVIQFGDSSETLSQFNDRYEIALHGVAAQQGLPVDDALRQQLEPFKARFLEQRAVELVLFREAQAQGFSASEEEVNAEIEEIRANLQEGDSFEALLERAGFRDEALLRSYLEEQLVVEQLVSDLRSDISVSEEEVAAAYEAQQDELAQPEQVCAQHILVATEEEAQEVLDELENGADFALLASERSTDPGSAANGGDLGCFAAEMMVEPFAEAAFAAELNEPVGPVESEFGYHVILAYDRQEAGVPPLEDVREALTAQLEQEALQARIDELREASGVEIFPDALSAAPAEESGE